MIETVAPGMIFLEPLYAGAHEPRLGVQYAPTVGGVEIDAGVSLVLAALHITSLPLISGSPSSIIGLGIDAHSRSAIDIMPVRGSGSRVTGLYAGANLSWLPKIGSGISDLRIRYAYVGEESAAVDMVTGEHVWEKARSLDIMIATRSDELGLTEFGYGVDNVFRSTTRLFRPYIGARLRFGEPGDGQPARILYGGIDGGWEFRLDHSYEDRRLIEAITLRFGYEATAAIDSLSWGHEARVGVKLGHWRDRGIVIEAGYHTGPSRFGAPSSMSAEYFWVGLAYDHLEKIF
jgi:hypothetical protein